MRIIKELMEIWPNEVCDNIADITHWVTESVNRPSSIYWRRPAKVGKLAITQTCAEKLKESKYLRAAFFFTIDKHSICHTYSLPSLINLQLRSLNIAGLLMRGSQGTRLLLRRKYHLNSDH